MQRAPPVTLMSPDPLVLSAAVPVACAATSPEPLVVTVSVSHRTALASMSPLPLVEKFAVPQRPRPSAMSPEPEIESASDGASTAATVKSPDPLIRPLKFPLVGPTCMSPDPLIDAPDTVGADTRTVTLSRLLQVQLPGLVAITSASPFTRMSSLSRSAAAPSARTEWPAPVVTTTSIDPLSTTSLNAPTEKLRSAASAGVERSIGRMARMADERRTSGLGKESLPVCVVPLSAPTLGRGTQGRKPPDGPRFAPVDEGELTRVREMLAARAPQATAPVRAVAFSPARFGTGSTLFAERRCGGYFTTGAKKAKGADAKP